MSLRLTFHDDPPSWVLFVRWLAKTLGWWLPRRLVGAPQPLHRPDFQLFWLWEYMDVVLSARINSTGALHGARYACLLKGFLSETELNALPDKTWPPAYVFTVLPPAGRFASLAEIQSIFPVPQRPVGTPPADSDEAFVLDLFNGMGPALVLRQLSPQLRAAAPGSPSICAVCCNFIGLERDPSSPYQLPSCVIDLEFQTGAQRPLPKLVALHLSYDEGHHWQEYRPSDGAWLWQTAKRAVRGALLLSHEIEEHIGAGHVLAELGLVALHLFAKKDGPMFRLLHPHLRDADGINDFGNPLIFASTGILSRASGLASWGVLQQILRNWTKLNPLSFEPPRCLGAWHTYGKVAERMWRAVDAHVDAEMNGISLSWWLRPLRSVLTRTAKFLIFHATFYHTWCNDRQADVGGDLSLATFGLRERVPFPEPSVAAQQDWQARAEPKMEDALYQLFLARALTSAKAGYVVPRPERAGRETHDHEEAGESAVMRRFAEHVTRELQGCAAFKATDLRARVNT